MIGISKQKISDMHATGNTTKGKQWHSFICVSKRMNAMRKEEWEAGQRLEVTEGTNRDKPADCFYQSKQTPLTDLKHINPLHRTHHLNYGKGES